jgi:glycosyltransferase involved in cell wall biosynthesis
MQILSVFFHPASGFTAVGGAEKRFVEVLKVWDRNRVLVTVLESSPRLTPHSCRFCESDEISGSLAMERRGIFSIYLSWVLWVVKACFLSPRLIKRKDNDIILASNNTLPNLILAYMLHVLSRRPLVVTVHHFDFPYFDRTANLASAYWTYRKSRFGRSVAFVKAVTFFIMLVLVRRCNMCITVSNSTGRFLLRNGVSPSKIRVSGNGVDVDLIQSFEAGTKCCTGIFVGRVSRDKGVFDLVEICERIASGRPCFELCVVGSGADMIELKRRIRESDMSSHIVLKGSCSDAELYAQMKASRIFLFPSMFEGWGLAVGEALACGLPVVCYDIPALREVFGECRSVFFVPVGDIARFAQTVEKILGQGNFAELEKISKEFVKRFRWDKVALEDLKVIETLVRQRHSGRRASNLAARASTSQ